jgi:hypothetical protein
LAPIRAVSPTALIRCAYGITAVAGCSAQRILSRPTYHIGSMG